MSNKEILKREVRFAVPIPRGNFNEDTHYVKELVTFTDGTSEPKISLIENYMRPAWVTREDKRNHREKKQYEDKENLIVRMTTDSDLHKTYANMIGEDWLADKPRLLAESPYVYAMDITAAHLIKLTSLMANDFIQTPYTLAVFDLETDLVKYEPILGNVGMVRNGVFEIYCPIWTGWMEPVKDIEARLIKKFADRLPEYKDKIIIKSEMFDCQVELLKALFVTANRWQPDWLAAWNIAFDIGDSILPFLERRNVRYTDVFCDPRLPKNLRRFKYIPGQTKKVTSSGKITPIPPADRWHKIECTSTFYFVDSMCVYRRLRVHKGKDPSYAMDAILTKEELDNKIRFSAADAYTGAGWHVFMQETFKEEYCIYGMGDIIRPIELDAKTGDLSSDVPVQCEITPFKDFNGSEKKAYSSLFIYGLSKGKIIGTAINTEKSYASIEEDYKKIREGTASQQIMNKYNPPGNRLLEPLTPGDLEVYRSKVYGIDDWIQTVPQGFFLRIGLKIFKDFPFLITNLRVNVSDLDSVSSYPSCIMGANVSKETTHTEVIEIIGIPVNTGRMLGLGSVVGHTNMLEYGHVMFGLPNLEEVYYMYKDGTI